VVVVVIGAVLVEPAATGVTVPILLSIENEVALVVVQERVDESPELIEVGFAVSVQASGGGPPPPPPQLEVQTGGVTVTVVVQVTVPPGPVAVPV
jgi:hypothetical protein